MLKKTLYLIVLSGMFIMSVAIPGRILGINLWDAYRLDYTRSKGGVSASQLSFNGESRIVLNWSLVRPMAADAVAQSRFSISASSPSTAIR